MKQRICDRIIYAHNVNDDREIVGKSTKDIANKLFVSESTITKALINDTKVAFEWALKIVGHYEYFVFSADNGEIVCKGKSTADVEKQLKKGKGWLYRAINACEKSKLATYDGYRVKLLPVYDLNELLGFINKEI